MGVVSGDNESIEPGPSSSLSLSMIPACLKNEGTTTPKKQKRRAAKRIEFASEEVH